MFEKEADKAETKMIVESNGVYSKFKNYKEGFKDGAEFGYNRAEEDFAKQLKEVVETCNHWQEVAEKANEWHYVKDKLPPEPDGKDGKILPKTYICAYRLNNAYDDFEIGDFMYLGSGIWNGENKEYPIYAWLATPVDIPEPPKEIE